MRQFDAGYKLHVGYWNRCTALLPCSMYIVTSSFFIFGSIAAVCWTAHFAKRLLETIFVHRFSHATMPLFNLFKVSYITERQRILLVLIIVHVQCSSSCYEYNYSFNYSNFLFLFFSFSPWNSEELQLLRVRIYPWLTIQNKSVYHS